MKIFSKLFFAFLSVALIFGCLTFLIFTYTFNHTYDASKEMSGKIYPRVLMLDAMKYKISSTHLDMVNYISGDNVTSREILDELNALKDAKSKYVSSHDDAENEEEISLSKSIDLFEQAAKRIIDKKEANATYEELNFMEREEFHNSLTELNDIIEEHDLEYMVKLETANNHLIDDYKMGRLIILYSLILIVLLSIFLGFIVSNNLSKPLVRLNEAADAIRHGGKVKAVADSNDEIGDLAKSFNQMVDELEKKNAHLEDKIDEINKFTKLVVGRELKMLELKKNIEEIEKRKNDGGK